MILFVPFLLLTSSITLQEVGAAVEWIYRPRSRLFINEGQTARINWKFVQTGAILVVYEKRSSSLATKGTRIALKREESAAEVVNNYKDKIFVENSGALNIRNASIRDEGFYHIRITYDPDTLIDEVEIKIQKAPVITKFRTHPKIDVYYTGMKIKLVCLAKGRPVPEVAIYKNDLKHTLEKSTGSIVHTINSASEKDSGKYICLSSNQAGETNETIEFVVYRRPHDVDFVHNTALDGTIFEGQSVIFSCSAKGSPPVSHYSLYQNGRELLNMTKGIFKINEVRLENSGRYTCVPINKAGLGENKTTILRVKARPSYWEKELTTTTTTTTSQPSKKQAVTTTGTTQATERIDEILTKPSKGNLKGAGNVFNSNFFLVWISLIFIQILQFTRD